MRAVSLISAYNPIIQRLGLKTSSLTARTCGVSAVAAKQNPHMHLISIALEPAEESAHPVPTIIVIFFIPTVRPSFTIDDEILIGLRQFFERNVDINFFPGTRAKQILLRFAEFLTAKYTHRALANAEASVGQRFIQVDSDGSAKSATFRTCA